MHIVNSLKLVTALQHQCIWNVQVKLRYRNTRAGIVLCNWNVV